jgi:hypothetical protein
LRVRIAACVIYIFYFPLLHVRSAERDISALITPLYTPYVLRDTFSVETCPKTVKMHSFTWFWWKLSVISFVYKIFRRWSAHFTPFHTPNVVHATFSMETVSTARKIQSFTWFWRKISVICFVFQIFRRLGALITPLYTPNVLRDTFSVKTCRVLRSQLSLPLRLNW